MGQRVNKKEEKRTDIVISAFQDAIGEASETAIQFVQRVLRDNQSLLFTLNGLLKDDALVALMDGRFERPPVSDSSGLSEEQQKELRAVRAGVRTLTSLKVSEGLLDYLLLAIRPDFKHDTSVKMNVPAEGSKPACERFGLDALSPAVKSEILAMLLRFRVSMHLPSHSFEDCGTWGRCKAAVRQHYEQTAHSYRNLDLSKLQKGYYSITSDGKAIESPAFHGAKLTMPEHTELLSVINPFELSDDLRVKAKVSEQVVELGDVFKRFVEKA